MKSFFILLFLCILVCWGNVFSQVKLSESFEGSVFPPAGWSTADIVSGNGEWSTSHRITRSGNKCAVSNFTPTGSNNFLITKRIILTAGDSLVFFFRQTFWSVYKDTFNVFLSNIDSTTSNMTHLLFSIKDSISYPSPLTYGRYSISLNSYSGQTVWIGFQHKNLDGDNIRLDDISVGNSYVNEVGVTQNFYPQGTMSSCAVDFIIPKAAIHNYGSNNQASPFNVTYSVAGAVNYQNTIAITLNSNETKTISFDTLIITAPGIYNIKIFTSLVNDQNKGNDTLKTDFTIVNANYGGGLAENGGYYYSNSSGCSSGAPAHPEYCWMDTSGSISLICNQIDVSQGLLKGNIDDGYFILTNFLPQWGKIKFFGINYDSVFISTNGMIGLNRNNCLLSSDPLQLNSHFQQQASVIYPFWCDFDFGSSGDNRLSYKIAGNHLIITYDKASLKNSHSDEYATFQVCLEIVNVNSPDSKILFQYNNENSGQDFIANFSDNLFPPHFVGIKSFSGNNFLKYRYKDSSSFQQYGPLYNESMALEMGTNSSGLNNKCSKLDLKLFLEKITPLRDTVTLQIRDSGSPYNIFETKKMYLDNNGVGSADFTIPSDSYNYYLVVSHRNSIETWSRIGGELFGNHYLNFDFTTDATKAYNNNLLIRDNKAYVYSGDVDKNGFIDVVDMVLIHNDALIYLSGYNTTDLNGDDIVDVSDLLSCYNNTLKLISIQSPLLQ